MDKMVIECIDCGEDIPLSNDDGVVERCQSCQEKKTFQRLLKTYRTQFGQSESDKPNIDKYGTLKAIQEIYDEWDGCSVISGECDGKDLSLFRYWRELELAPWNTVLVTKKEGQSMSNMKKKPHKMHERFPPAICREMIVRRFRYEQEKKKKKNAVSP